ncbi:MAG: Fic family protein [Candidatus Lokiarchaeota archaeon]|nr:Fic family protein [Candidatus Lokiarchaeota archaeon]
MTFITTKTINGKKYTYLRYSYRENGKTRAIEMAAGNREASSAIPMETKEKFVVKVFTKRWLDSVEAMKKGYARTLIRYTPLTQERFFDDFGMHFTHNTNKIEGSTLTFFNVKNIIVNNASPPNKPVNDVTEAQTHMNVYRNLLREQRDLSLGLILEWHATLFGITKPGIAGSIRNGPIMISGSKHLPPPSRAEVDDALDRMMRWYARCKEELHPALLACLMKLKFVSIHPFEDGNGRVSRVIMNYLLHKNGYPMFDIDFKLRMGYYSALEQANINEEDLHFVHWFFTHYTKRNRSFLS